MYSFTLDGYFQFIQYTEQRQGYGGIQQPENNRLLRIEAQRLTQQRARENPIEELMEEVKEEAENEGDHRVLNVESHADGGREISHQGFHDAIHTYRLMRQRVLHQADEHPVEQGRNRPAPAEREMHGDEQRQLQIRQKRDETRHIDLGQHRDQGDNYQPDKAKPIGRGFARSFGQQSLGGLGHWLGGGLGAGDAGGTAEAGSSSIPSETGGLGLAPAGNGGFGGKPGFVCPVWAGPAAGAV